MEDEKLCRVPFIGDIINSNFNICDEILDAYYRQVPQPIDRKEISEHYIGKINHYNSSYQVCIYGAYPLMTQWEMLEYNMNNTKDKHFKAYKRDAVYENLKDFARGFQNGFDNFIKDKVNDNYLLADSEISKVQSIMDFLSSPSGIFGFSESHGTKKHIFSNWYNDGIIGGYHYCAWIVIFKNHKLFEPHFKKQKFETEVLDKGKKEFTTARQVLALHYLFEHLKLKDVDFTQKARFIQFLTGKEVGVKKISDTNIYKQIRNPLSKNENTLSKDLQYIRTYFENLGLFEIAQKITKEIGDKE